MLNRQRTVRILGTHGIPGSYGGFETAAENIARYLVRKGWRVIVYCQSHGTGRIVEDVWEGIERVTIPVNLPGWRGTAKFDWLSIGHACRFEDLCLTFGYNTGAFNFRQRLHGLPNVINMDGLEWRRKRWGVVKQAVLYVNERLAALFGNHLIADHPEIEKHLLTRAAKRKISTITYGADPIVMPPSAESLVGYGLEAGKYVTLIARPIPENSILEIVRGFSSRLRDIKLALLGKYEPTLDPYHRAVVDAASEEVVFVGPVYGSKIVPIRYHGLAYLHGHTVGGTNPSLVEALAAGNPVIAHDNAYNRWVARDAAVYFTDADSFAAQLTSLLADPHRLATMRDAALTRFDQDFTWDYVAGQYEAILLRFQLARAPRSSKESLRPS